MAIQFNWDNKYSVGNPEIDEQHKGIFALCNKMPEVLTETDVKPVIMKLFKYTREHFMLEEEMMKSIGFPLYTEHKTIHDEIISKLNEISSSPFDSDEALLQFKEFLYNWLTEHILVQDMKYARYKQEQG